MSPRVVVALTGFALLAGSLPAGAQVLAGLDQYQLGGTVNGLNHAANPFGQWFTVGSEGVLSHLELCLESTAGNTEDLVIEIRDVNAGLPGVTLGSVALGPTAAGPYQNFLLLDTVTATLVDLRTLGIEVTTGDLMAFWLSTTMPSSNGWVVRFSGGDPYAAGQMTTPSGVNVDNDLTFKTFVEHPIFGDDFETGDTSAWANGKGPR